MYVIFIHSVYGYLAPKYLVGYLYNNSSIIENSNSVSAGYLNLFIMCVRARARVCLYLALGTRLHNCRREPKYGNCGTVYYYYYYWPVPVAVRFNL